MARRTAALLSIVLLLMLSASEPTIIPTKVAGPVPALLAIHTSGGYIVVSDPVQGDSVGLDAWMWISRNGAVWGRSTTGEIVAARLPASQVARLLSLLNQTDFARLRTATPARGCPSAVDLPDTQIIFYTDTGAEMLDSCETEFNWNEPLLQHLRQLAETIQ